MEIRIDLTLESTVSDKVAKFHPALLSEAHNLLASKRVPNLPQRQIIAWSSSLEILIKNHHIFESNHRNHHKFGEERSIQVLTTSMLHILSHGHPLSLPHFHTLSSRKLDLSSQFPLPYSHINPRHNCHFSTICASSFKKPPRASKKVKSDADLCNDIKEFLYTVGLPENHVPTTKELSNHGRQDLANIVRRRGYKFIRQLLEASSTENFLGFNIDTGQAGNLEVLSDSGGQNEKLKVLSADVLSNENLQEDNLQICTKTKDEELQLNDQSSIVAESNTLSLQEKVAKFIQLGELDIIEDSGFGIMNEEYAVEEGNSTGLEDSHEPEFAFSMPNGNVPSSAESVEGPVLENTFSSYISTKDQTSIGHDEDLDDEKQKGENQAEVKRLKFLLHQKELELTHLKQQIEKEKLALSLLQTKAEKEISKAQELVSEEETELQTAEETLSGLKEVEILYSGDGDIVELAGSFNGWHHKVPMEPQLSSCITDLTGSRTCQLWRAFLWLYPGVYEIKFVVDGDWRIDPQRESTTRHGLHNNILRVDR